MTDNLRTCAGLLATLVPQASDRERIAGRIAMITEALGGAPKTVGWQLRAKVGRRKRWYQVPEEVTR